VNFFGNSILAFFYTVRKRQTRKIIIQKGRRWNASEKGNKTDRKVQNHYQHFFVDFICLPYL
jgi:hypothetical protein